MPEAIDTAMKFSEMTGTGKDDVVDSSPIGKWQHPPSFYCPISQQCMHDPVVLSDGHSYERRHIERWLQEHNTSPVSGSKLLQKEMFPNHALRNAIEEYFQQVFSVHRRAIRKTMSGSSHELEVLGSNGALLRTVDALMQCSLLVNADLSTEYVLHQIMNEAKTLVGAEVASVFLVDRARQELYSTVNSTGGEIRIPMTAGIAGTVATTGEPLAIHDAYSDERFNKSVDIKTGFKTRDILCVPLKSKKVGIIGVVQLINKTSDGVLSKDGSIGTGSAGFKPDDLHFLQVFASQAAMAIAGSQSFDEMQKICTSQPKAKSATVSPWEFLTCCFTRDSQKTKVEESSKLITTSAAKEPMAEASSFPANASKGDVGEPGLAFSRQSSGRCSLSNCGSMCLNANLSAEAEALLDEASTSWQIDSFRLASLTENKPLSTLACDLFERHSLIDEFDLQRPKVACFFLEIEKGYPDENPYHNRAHAAAVVQVMDTFLQQGGLAEIAAAAYAREQKGAIDDKWQARHTQLVRMACLIAAAAHDFEHRGVSNDFLINTRSDRALRYNDRHVNEHHHAAGCFIVLQRSDCNFLEGLPDEEYKRVRSIVIDLIIGTDMAIGGKIVSSFNEVVQAANGRRQESPSAQKSQESVVGANADTAPAAGFSPLSAKETVLLLQMAMKCADVGHLSLDWDLHVKWVKLLEDEFFKQGDKEKAIGFSAVSFLMDRDKPGPSKTQVGFMEYVVLPMFNALAQAAPGTRPVLEAVSANLELWREVEAGKRVF